MSEPTPISVGIREIDGRLFVDRNDLLAAVGEINRRGGPTHKVIELLSCLNPLATENNLDVEA